jgi:hypothetical protein
MAPPSACSPGWDQEMADHSTSLPHLQSRAPQGIPPIPVHEATPRTRLNFEITDPASTPTDGKTTSFNPFAEDGEEARRTDLLQKPHEDTSGGWTFQGKKKLPAKIISPRQDPALPFSHTPRPTSMPGGKKGQTNSELHHTYFKSLGIPVPIGQDFCKARVWPVLSRAKNERKQILVHARN